MEVAEEDICKVRAWAEEKQREAVCVVAQAHHSKAKGWQIALKAGQHPVLHTAEIEVDAEEQIRAAGKQANVDAQSLVHAVAQHANTVIVQAVSNTESSTGLAW